MSDENTGRKQGHRWQKGESGNRSGKPPGARNHVTLAVEAMMEGEGAAIARKAVAMAKAGDVTALRIVLDRIAPMRRSRPVHFRLPTIANAADLPAALAAVTRAVAAGELTPDEAQAVASVLEVQRRGIETADLATRIAALEAGHGE